jgi:hypothetical protein
VALSNAERNRRYRARRRGENVPRLPPGRPRFRAEFPEEIVGELLNIDPQRLRDLESAVTSRGLTLAQFVERKREQLPYGQPETTDATDEAPLDPLTEAILNFDLGDAE